MPGSTPVIWRGAVWAAGGALVGALLMAPRPTGESTPTAVADAIDRGRPRRRGGRGGLVSSSAALGLRDRAGSALAGRRRLAPGRRRRGRAWCRHPVRCARPAWGDAADGPSFRVDAQLGRRRRPRCPSRARHDHAWPFRPRRSPSAVDSDSRPGSHRCPRPSRARSGWPSTARSHSSRRRPRGSAGRSACDPASPTPRRDSAATAARSCPASRSATRPRVGAELDAAMKASSLSHLTAVSGANCAIVTAAAFAARGALRPPSRRSRRGRPAGAAGFVVLVTPAAERRARRRRWPSWCSSPSRPVVRAAASPRCRSPSSGCSPSTRGSLATTASRCRLPRRPGCCCSPARSPSALARVMPTPLAVLLAVPVAAQLACQPILILLDPAIALYGVPANLLAAPAAPVGNRPRTDRVPRAPRAALGRGRDPAGGVGARVVDRARRARRFGAPGRSAPVAPRCGRAPPCSPPAPRWPLLLVSAGVRRRTRRRGRGAPRGGPRGAGRRGRRRPGRGRSDATRHVGCRGLRRRAGRRRPRPLRPVRPR